MTFVVTVPNQAQSPGIFPAQNNTNFGRLKTIIQGDHVFNDTQAANDGVHNQVTLVNRVDPNSLPAGTNSMVYGKAAADATNELWYYDAVTPRQLNWRMLTGTVVINSSTFVAIVAIPTNCFGYIYMWKGRFIQAGTFVSDGTVVNGYAYSEKYETSSASNILRFGFDGSGASALNLTVMNADSGSGFNGTWTYQIFYRKYA